MNANESAPAPATATSGNQNVRQLAATLTKLTASGGTKKEPAATAAPVAAPAPAESEATPGEEQSTESLTTSGEEGTTDQGTTDNETTAAAEATTASPDAETTETTPEEEPKAELPEEIREAIEIAKAQDGGKGKAEMLKRIHKLTDARDTERNARLTAEDQVTQLRRELQEARTVKPTASAAPAGTHPAVHAVQQELAKVDEALGWCEEQLPRLQSGEVESVEVPDGKGGKATATLKDVAKARRDLEHQRQELVAKKVATEGAVKAAFNEAHSKAHQSALTVYPWLKNQSSPEYAQFQEILKIMPGFRHLPDHELAIGDFLAGKAAREARAKAPAAAPTRKPAPARVPTRVATEAPSGGAEGGDPTEKGAKEASQTFAKSGSTKDLARALTARRQAVARK